MLSNGICKICKKVCEIDEKQICQSDECRNKFRNEEILTQMATLFGLQKIEGRWIEKKQEIKTKKRKARRAKAL